MYRILFIHSAIDGHWVPSFYASLSLASCPCFTLQPNEKGRLSGHNSHGGWNSSLMRTMQMASLRQIKEDWGGGLVHSPLTPPFSFGSGSCTPALIVKCTTEAVQVDWHPKLSSIPPPEGPNLTPERYRETVRDISLTLGHISGFSPAYALQGETPKWDKEFWGQRQMGQQTHCSFLKDLSSDLLGDLCPQSRALPSSPPLASYNNILCFSYDSVKGYYQDSWGTHGSSNLDVSLSYCMIWERQRRKSLDHWSQDSINPEWLMFRNGLATSLG